MKVIAKNKADIVTRPQIYFEDKKNINYTKFFERKYKLNTTNVKWAATNNVFFKYNIIKNKRLIFDKFLNKFGMGEDQLFFSLLNQKGCKIFWNKNIQVYEKIHKHRNNIYWLISRSFRLGVLGNYIDRKMHGIFLGYIINYLKCILYFFYTIKTIFTIYDKNSRIFTINFFFRFFGKLVGPIIFNKIEFLKNVNKQK